MTDGKRVSPWKRVAVALILVVVVVVSFLVGSGLASRFLGPPVPREPAGPRGAAALVVLCLVLGVLLLGAALVGYGIAVATRCFTLDLRRPFLPGYKKKVWVANVLVSSAALAGLGLLACAFLGPLLLAMGLPVSVAAGVPFLIVLVAGQLALVWFGIWTPVSRALVRERLAAQGVERERIARATLVGIQDPARSSLRKLSLVADDAGGLWIEPEQLVYAGDSDRFTVRRDQLLEMTRAADPGSTASYAGAVHPLLRFRTPEGAERAVRLHSWGRWSLGAAARELDALAESLERWKSGTPPSP